MASLDADSNPAKSLGVGDVLLLRDPLLTNGLRVGCRPAIGQQMQQIRTTRFQSGRMPLLGLGQLAQHVLQVMLQHQVMTMGAADEAEQLKGNWCHPFFCIRQ